MENTINTNGNPSFIRRVFISPDETRLRSGWRLLLQTLLLLLIGLIIVIPLSILIQYIQLPPIPVLEIILNGSIQFVAITASVFISRRIFDRRTIISLGLRFDKTAVEDLLAGFLIPALMIALILIIERVLGWTEILGVTWQQNPLQTVLPSILTGLAAFIIVGWQEELLTRGYQLQNLEDGLNLPLALILSSFVFGALHLANPNSEQKLMVTLGIFLAGLFFGYAYIRTRQLWLPIGLHIGWNFFEGPIFGFPVSGLEANGLFIHNPNGPELITGGAFGPEAGLIIIPALLLGVGLVYYVTHGREIVRTDGSLTHQAHGSAVPDETEPAPTEHNT